MRIPYLILFTFIVLTVGCEKENRGEQDIKEMPVKEFVAPDGGPNSKDISVSQAKYAAQNWLYYHGDSGGTHYSALDQINVDNVSELEVSWVHDTNDAFAYSEMQTNPLIAYGRMFVISPKGRLICLDPATGAEIWSYDPAVGESVKTKQRQRGVSWWREGDDVRVFFSFGKDLIAIDAETGAPIESFGTKGRVDLRKGLGRDVETISVSSSSPGAVYKDLLIMGSTGNAPGDVRAYDVRTGAIRWTFHTIPRPGEYGIETWPEGAWETAVGANVWAGMALDGERGLVFLPTGSPSREDRDFYGADRHGYNLFGTSLVALNADTGERVWHFQFVKHDLWDRDLPTQPTLVTVRRDGVDIPAVAQPTKQGLLYVFNRETGEPHFPMEEREVFASDVPGEQAALTQTMPLSPAPFARQHLTADMLTQRTPEAAQAAAEYFATVRSRGPFDPPSLQGTIIFPGFDGGVEWGGAAYDPETGILYVNSNEMAWTLKLRSKPKTATGTDGRALYMNNCIACHGETLAGSPPEFPSLVDVGERLSSEEIHAIIAQGGGRMPAFGQLSSQDLSALIEFLQSSGREAVSVEGATKDELHSELGGPDYIFDGYRKFLDPDGYPAITPPWGTLSAIDVSTGEYKWKIPFGEYPALAAQDLNHTGSENYGGGVVTKGGVFIIAATVYDNKIRAFDKLTGELLWQDTLPAAGNATPATYMADGRQFVVIAAGGGKNVNGKSGGKIVAYALPEGASE